MAEVIDIKHLGWRRRDFILSGSLLVAAAAPLYAQAAGEKTILVVGDSLSAEYGLARGTGWVALLSARLEAEKRPYQVVNASISGDTTSGGRSRLGVLLKQHHPAIVVIELGGNDALRGLPLAMSESNLAAMAQAATEAGAKVLLVGMQVPPNYGADYARRFSTMFDTVAKSHQAALVPFLLKGIADDADPTRWFQPDRIHPLASAHPAMLNNVWAGLVKLLK
jgi:acyl-CoA thioesterase-1